MLYFANWKVILICAVCAAGVILSIPNLFTEQQLAALPRWLPQKQVSLGLDLRGGSYLLLEVDVAAAERERLNSVEETEAGKGSALGSPEPDNDRRWLGSG